jgi:alpha-1,6-mannosyltransferase
LLGGASFICYWLLMSIALNPKLQIVYSVKGATYGGPLVWPSRWFHLATLPALTRMWLFMFLVIALTLMWLAAIYVVRKDSSRGTALIIGGAFLLFALLFVFGPTFQSKDVFSYIFHGRAMSVYHSNPYLLIPHARTGDVFYPLIGWKFNASVYGPVYNFISYAITKVAGNSVAANVLGFKMLAFLSYAACLPLVYWLTKRVTPGKENMALAITAWCPILVMHVLGAGHNDPVMVAFLLAGFLLYRKGYLLTGIAFVVLGAMVKITGALALAPMLVMYVRDRRGAPLKRAAAAGGVVVGLSMLVYLPFLSSLKIFGTTLHMTKLYSTSSIPNMFSDWYRRILVGGGMGSVRAGLIANSRVHILFTLLLVAIAIVLLTRVKDYRSMVACSAGLFLAWFLTSSWLLPWYLFMGLAFAAILGWSRITAFIVGLAAIFILFRIPQPPGGAISGTGPVYFFSIPFLLIFIGWASLSGVEWLQRRRAAAESPAPAGVVEEA